MPNLKFRSKINYDRDFHWLAAEPDIEVSDTPLKKTTDISKLGLKSRQDFCERVFYLYFLMVFSSPYIFPKITNASFYFDKRKNKLIWHPGVNKLKLSNKTQMQLCNVYKSIYVDSKTTDLAVDGFFWNKPKNQDVFDRLVRLHMRAHFSGPIEFNLKTEIFNTARTVSFMAINRLVPSTDMIKFVSLLVNIHLILVRSGISINFKPLAQKAYAASQTKVVP